MMLTPSRPCTSPPRPASGLHMTCCSVPLIALAAGSTGSGSPWPTNDLKLLETRKTAAAAAGTAASALRAAAGTSAARAARRPWTARALGAPRPGRQLRPLQAAACACGWPETAAQWAAVLVACARPLRQRTGRRCGRPAAVAWAALTRHRAGSCVVRGRPFGALHGSTSPPTGWRAGRAGVRTR